MSPRRVQLTTTVMIDGTPQTVSTVLDPKVAYLIINKVSSERRPHQDILMTVADVPQEVGK